MDNSDLDEEEKLDRSFDSSDRKTIISLAFFLSLSVVLFFGFVHWQGLISYPEDKLSDSIKNDSYDYFAYALEYRERRLSLALTYRTFITSFGFTVGLVLSTIGGLFVLRRATASFEASGGGGDATGEAEKAKFSLITNSPGILFMIGGVAIMIVTQYLAIPVGSPEIFPQTAAIRCTPEAEEKGTCYIDDGASELATIVALCEEKPELENCVALEKLRELVE